MFPGGIADKLGNEYERKWAVLKFIEVVEGRATSVRYEGVSKNFRGFEFALDRPDHMEWHQTKINAPSGNWALNALKKEGVMGAFKRRLSTDVNARCVFVSQDPARQMRELCDKARTANNLHEFRDAVSNKDGETFNDLAKMWDVDEQNAFEWLQRCEFRTESRQTIDEAIERYGRHLVRGDADLYSSLSNFLLNNLNARITTENVREWIRKSSPFTFRPAALDPALRETVDAANQRYLKSYTPFGFKGQQIPRAEAGDVLAELQAVDGPSLILLTGEAGSGKSGVVREVMTGLRDRAIPNVAFRMDRYLSCRTGNEIGSVLLNRDESPVSALQNLAEDSASVLIVDQIDAVSEISGRTGAVKDALFELVREAQYYGNVRCLLVCRSFDLENDPQYRDLGRRNKAKQVRIPHLSWEHGVAPILEHAGVATECLTEGQRKLLALPINLSVFLEIDDPAFGFTTGTELMQRLFEKKTHDLQKDRNVGWSVQAPLYAMAEWMSNRQELSCPDSVLDDFDGAKGRLSSEGLTVVEQHRLAFFHESFFDFIFARTFSRSDRDIADFLTSTEQHLFRRTQVRQILTSMRDTDKPRYLKSLKTVLTHPKIRTHIKHAVARWLASLDNTTLDELRVIQQLDDDGEEFPVLMRKALFISECWFDLLNEGRELSSMLRTAEKPRLRYLLRWLSDIADKRPGPVAALLRNWWDRDPSRTDQLTEWFVFKHPMPADRALAALLCDVIGSAPRNLFLQDRWHGIVRLLPSLCGKEPEASSEILRALFTQWFEHFPGKHPFTHHETQEVRIHDLARLAEKAPAVFLDGMIPALVESARIALNENSSDYGIPVLYKTSDESGPVALFSLYRDAFRMLAETSPLEAESRLNQLDPTLDKVLLHLHIETIRANATALGHRFAALLDEQHLFSAGLEGAEWKSFAEAARSAVKANCLPVHTIEERVFRHRPENDLAKRILHKIEEKGESEPFSTKCYVLKILARSGYVEWCVLRTIGHYLLSSRGKRRLAELERKFPNEEVPKPCVYEATLVGSPIPPDATLKMTDAQWLSAINKDWDQNRKLQFRKGEIIGSALELAQELEVLSKSDPGRFARFFLQLPDSADSIYGQHVLQGLAGTEQVDENATIETLRAAHAHRKRPFGLQILRLAKNHPVCARDDDVFEALLWYAEHGEASETLISGHEEHTETFPSIHDLVHVNTPFVINGINSARGVAWQVLGQVVESNPHRAAEIWALVERRAGEETFAPVQAMILYTLAPLFGLDPARFSICIRRLTKPLAGERDDVSALAPLVTRMGVRLFPYIERYIPDLALELMGRMIVSPDRNLNLIGTWWALAERLRQGNSTDRFPNIQQQSPAHAKLWASILCQFAARTEFRDMAISELEELFSHGDPEVRKEAAKVFQHIPGDDFPHFMDLAWAFVRSPLFKDAAYPIIKALEQTSHDVTELVVEVSEILVRHCGGVGDIFLYQVQKILKREYVNSEDRPELRTRFLDLIDDMAAKNLIGTDDLIRLDDR